MKWEGNRESDNVEDRRSSGGGMPVFGGRSIGIGTIVIALLGGWALGINPLTILSLLSGGGAPTAQVLFFESDKDDVCEVSYKDRGGKYQGQVGVTLPKA